VDLLLLFFMFFMFYALCSCLSHIRTCGGRYSAGDLSAKSTYLLASYFVRPFGELNLRPPPKSCRDDRSVSLEKTLRSSLTFACSLEAWSLRCSCLLRMALSRPGRSHMERKAVMYSQVAIWIDSVTAVNGPISIGSVEWNSWKFVLVP
jgi:hypothetical protein